MTKVYKARLIKHTNALQSIFVQSQEHHRPETSIRRRGKWETLAKSDKRLGGSDATELAAGDGEAPLLHHKGRQSLADSFSTGLSKLELVPR